MMLVVSEGSREVWSDALIFKKSREITTTY